VADLAKDNRKGTRKTPARVFARRRSSGLVGQHERENDGGEGEPFDQGGGDDHVGADAAAGFGLAGDALDSLSADLPDAAPAADDGQSHSDAGAGDRKALFPDFGEDGHH
jgi:hypothetical protein